ncbi:MAG: 50S ribosomal protein L9 [Planctomycetota bacterium]|nr:50S ribosomal protein L9 [Planctomycetota bacterium]
MVQEKTKSRRKNGAGFKRLPKGPNGGVELLLIQSVDKLGKQGDVVEVKSGFANNYLLPQGMATIATGHHKRMVEKHREKLQQLEIERVQSLKEQAATISKLSVTIEANANDEGHLYGSVGAIEIVGGLKQNEIHVLPEQIKLEGVLKELGLYTVKVRLHKEVEAELKVWVVPLAAEEQAN